VFTACLSGSHPRGDARPRGVSEPFAGGVRRVDPSSRSSGDQISCRLGDVAQEIGDAESARLVLARQQEAVSSGSRESPNRIAPVRLWRLAILATQSRRTLANLDRYR
jgi:hypothetical protein